MSVKMSGTERAHNSYVTYCFNEHFMPSYSNILETYYSKELANAMLQKSKNTLFQNSLNGRYSNCFNLSEEICEFIGDLEASVGIELDHEHDTGFCAELGELITDFICQLDSHEDLTEYSDDE